MFENEIAINQFQLGYVKKLVADIPTDRWYQPYSGHAHCPAWIVGHLAIVGQLGAKVLGGEVTNPQWLPIFGPGSPGEVSADPSLEKQPLLEALETAYQNLQKAAAEASDETLQQPHSIHIFENTPIKTVGNLIALMLTNHFAFHLSQLSSCRREAGHDFLF